MNEQIEFKIKMEENHQPVWVEKKYQINSLDE